MPQGTHDTAIEMPGLQTYQALHFWTACHNTMVESVAYKVSTQMLLSMHLLLGQMAQHGHQGARRHNFLSSMRVTAVL